MSILLGLSTLAIREVVDGACAYDGLRKSGVAVVGFLTERFTDHSQRLTKALHSSNEKAWKALEIALAGDSLWDRCKVSIARSEDKAFSQQVRAFLDAAPLHELSGKKAIRQKCLEELRAARKAGVMTKGSLDHRLLAKQAGDFARFGDPAGLVDAEWNVLVGIATEMKEAGYGSLGWLLSQRSAQEMPVLIIAVRYFFRRAIEGDQKLFQGLAFAKLEALGEAQQTGFAALSGVLAQQAQRLEELLGDVKAVVVETHSAVLDLQVQMKGLSEETRQMFQAVMQQMEQRQLQRRVLRSGDSLSIRGDAERQLVKQLISRYRALPEEQREKTPALLNAIGKLEVVAGDFDAAQKDFQQVATLVSDTAAKAEAHFNAYHAALERRDKATALMELLHAWKLDGRRFAPFPIGKYRPKRILGAGGFGVAFLCLHTELQADVVVKTLATDDLGREVDEVLNEARMLYQLDHPSIIRLLDCGYTDSASKSRPYFVMNYFTGVTLEEYVQQRGRLSAQDLMAVGRQIAEGLRAAHRKGILHRDVKPANILVLKDGGGWKVKIIDFGLALKQERIANAASANRQSKSIMGSSIAGTLDYAAPEQTGRQKDAIGPYSDIYGFAKTCSFALFQTTQPLFKHWQSLPLPLAQLLEECLEEDPKKRPQTFGAVLKSLSGAKGNDGGPTEGTKSSASPTAHAIAVTALVAAGYVVAIVGGLFATFGRDIDDAWLRLIFSLLLVGVCWLAAFITSLLGLHRMWSVVARSKEDPTPEAAVGLLCVPFYNLYWMFRAIPGLSAAQDRELRERDPSGHHGTGWVVGLVACILFCVPYLNLISPIVFVVWLNLANGATNRLIRLREGGGGPRSNEGDAYEGEDDRRRQRPAKKKGRGTRANGAIIGAVLVVGCLGFVALLVPAVQHARAAARQAQQMNGMRLIALGQITHLEQFRNWAGPRRVVDQKAVELSWRVELLPFVEQHELFQRFDRNAAWYSLQNSPLASAMPKVYEAPARESPSPSFTYFQLFTGPNTIFSSDLGVGIADIRDGMSNTLLFADAASPVVWTEPRDMAIAPLDSLPLPQGRFTAAFGDGHVTLIDRSKVSDTLLRALIDPKDGRPAPEEMVP